MTVRGHRFLSVDFDALPGSMKRNPFEANMVASLRLDANKRFPFHYFQTSPDTIRLSVMLHVRLPNLAFVPRSKMMMPEIISRPSGVPTEPENRPHSALGRFSAKFPRH